MQTAVALIDIGCGDSDRCLRWLDLLPRGFRARCFCFEPLQERFKKATHKLKDEDRATVYPFVVSDYARPSLRKLKFHCANDQSSGSLLPFVSSNVGRWKYPVGRRPFKTVETRELPSLRMEKFILDQRIRDIPFVRIETQGTALDVLRSFGPTIARVWEFAIKVNVTDFEIYQGQTRKEELIQFMTQLNFAVYKTMAWSRDQEEIIWFVNRKLHKNQKPYHFDCPV